MRAPITTADALPATFGLLDYYWLVSGLGACRSPVLRRVSRRGEVASVREANVIARRVTCCGRGRHGVCSRRQRERRRAAQPRPRRRVAGPVSFFQDDDDDDDGGSTAVILGVVLVVLIGVAAISGDGGERQPEQPLSAPLAAARQDGRSARSIHSSSLSAARGRRRRAPPWARPAAGSGGRPAPGCSASPKSTVPPLPERDQRRQQVRPLSVSR